RRSVTEATSIRASDASAALCAAVGAPPAGVRLLVAGFLMRTAASAMGDHLSASIGEVTPTVGLPQFRAKSIGHVVQHTRRTSPREVVRSRQRGCLRSPQAGSP